MSIDSDGKDQATDLQRWYSGYLIVEHVSDAAAGELAALAKQVPSFDISSRAIELEYKGRDTSRVILRGLLRVAQLVGNARGEIRCQVSGDIDQLWFEFYRIRDGRLFRQRAEVVRQPEDEVTEATL